MLFPKDEIKRKTFHLLMLFYILAYWYLPLKYVSVAMGALIVMVLTGEILRLKNQQFNEFILKILGGVHRNEESGKISGLPWTLSGSLLTMLLFKDRSIVFVSLLFLAFGDTFAALVGKRFGRIKVFGAKTLEGSLACFLVCFIIGCIFLNIKIALAAALFMTIIELIPWPLNDNFWIPLCVALFLNGVRFFYG